MSRIGDRPGEVCTSCASFIPSGEVHECAWPPLYADDAKQFSAEAWVAQRGGKLGTDYAKPIIEGGDAG